MATLALRTIANCRMINNICVRTMVRRTKFSSGGARTIFSPTAASSSLNSISGQNMVAQIRFYKVFDEFNPSPNTPKPTKKQFEERVFQALNTFDRFPKEKTDTRRRSVQSPILVHKRFFGAKPPFTMKLINDRTLLVLKLFDKINPEKLTMDSHFINDLGLDSLDHVEIILAIEEEFTCEIPDGDAERLMTPKDIIQYMCDKEDIFE